MANLVFKKADDAKAAITDSARKEIAALYSKWSDEIGKKAEYYKTKTNASSWLQEMNMRQLQAQLGATSKHIANEVNGIVKDTIYQVSDAVVQANNDWLIKLGFPVTGVESAFVSVPDQTVRRLITGQIYESGWSLSKSIWSDNEDTLKKLYEIVAQGLAQNMTAYDISKLLEQYVDPSRAKQWNLRMADGKNIYKKAVDYNAQRLARTLAQHGYQTSVIAVTEKNPFIIDIIWRANGSRVCELCLSRDGQHFPKNDVPLDHPNGMCTMEPAVDPDLTDKLADWINSPDGTFPEIDAFASEFGYMPDVKKTVDESITFKNKQMYEEAKIKAKDDYQNRLSELEKERERAQEKLLNDFGGDFLEQRIKIRKDDSLSVEAKERMIDAILDKREKYFEELEKLNDRYGELKRQAYKEYKGVYEPSLEFNSRKEDKTLVEIARSINEKYFTFEYEYTNNCQRCSVAFELQERGLDVKACPVGTDGGRGAERVIKSIFADSERIDFNGGHEATIEIIEQMEKFGSGSRAIIITGNSDGSGHAFNVVNEDGNVFFVDSQCSKVWGVEKDKDATDGKTIEYCYKCSLYRTDKSKVYNEIPEGWIENI